MEFNQLEHYLPHYKTLAYTAYLPLSHALHDYQELGYEVIVPAGMEQWLEEVYFLIQNGRLFVAIAGTNEVGDWLRNFFAFKQSALHPGYEKAALTISRPLFELLSRRNDIGHITFLGHSKGGAVAAVLQWMIDTHYQGRYNVDAVSWGAPRFMNTLATALYRHDKYVRVVKPGDIVTMVPLKAMGYRHCGQVYIEQSDGHYLKGDDAWEHLKRTRPIWKCLLKVWTIIRNHDYGSSCEQ